jgi:hypothetical protein
MKPIVPISGIMQGGKWKVVDQFRGRSHRDGGIDIEVEGGIVRRIHAPDSKPDEIAKSGSFWKTLGAGAYGVGEGLLDTISMGATDQLTDMGYEALQKAGGSSEQEIREQNSVRGYGTTAGAITGGVLSGGAATGSAIQQGAKGLGAGISQGSPESKLAQGVGTYLPLAGNIAGMTTGNAGYAKGSKLGSFAQGAAKINKFNPLIQAGVSGFQATRPQALDLGPVQQAVRQVTPYVSPSMMQGYRQLGEELKGEANPKRGTGASSMEGPISYGGVQGGPIQFQAQPFQQAEAFNYLSRYGING